jgi:hypothetical protein
MNKYLAQMNKSPDVGKATKKHSALRDAAGRKGPNSTSIRSANLPRPAPFPAWLGAFSLHGFDEQIFGVEEQILGPGQTD